MSTGRLFQALGAATENARSDEPVLIAERPDHAFLLNGENLDLGRWPQMWPTLSNRTVLGHWSNGGPRDRVWTWFSLQLATSEARIEPVSRDHAVPNSRPSEQQHWWLSGAVLTLKPVNAPRLSCSNPTSRSPGRKPVLQWRRVPGYVLSIANDEDGRNRS